jgi:oxygen-independent coproporphyrinogen-3 oxidase
LTVEYGLYIHLPYCRSLCPYCAFAKAPLHHAEPARLSAALRLEWERARAEDAWDIPRTIYLGGGTPTALEAETLRGLLAWIRSEIGAARVREWTAEANPEGVTDRKLEVLLEGGVDRLSFGIQSLEPRVLRALGRIHTAEGALDALARARRAGFGNVSADLIVSVPGETAEGVRRSAEALVEAGVDHLSVYSLQVEEGTIFAAKVARGAFPPPREEDAASRYEELACLLEGAGYRHYEVSSWARPGFESRHNQGYWSRRPYLGLGAGAHSFNGTERWRNEEDVARYYERLEEGGLPREGRTRLTARDAAEETIMLGLRQARGLRRRVLNRLAGRAAPAWTEWAARAGAVSLATPGRVRPTGKGLLLSQELSAELLARMTAQPGGPA